uniref:ATP synthase complex subunit 8 n=1 Tax=Chiropterargas boueti TaxID=1827022 RepID=A0A1P8AGA3_9ACAR|nr:ATP synthase F0 subunit 8 [Chiropterargas boueti]AMX74108.1 ATP synthase F0 subunit 8 [Chiropterargas boueti]
MPQFYPMNWMIIFSSILLTLFLLFIMMYYLTQMNLNKKTTSNYNFMKNWKW